MHTIHASLPTYLPCLPPYLPCPDPCQPARAFLQTFYACGRLEDHGLPGRSGNLPSFCPSPWHTWQVACLPCLPACLHPSFYFEAQLGTVWGQVYRPTAAHQHSLYITWQPLVLLYLQHTCTHTPGCMYMAIHCTPCWPLLHTNSISLIMALFLPASMHKSIRHGIYHISLARRKVEEEKEDKEDGEGEKAGGRHRDFACHVHTPVLHGWPFISPPAKPPLFSIWHASIFLSLSLLSLCVYYVLACCFLSAYHLLCACMPSCLPCRASQQQPL